MKTLYLLFGSARRPPFTRRNELLGLNHLFQHAKTGTVAEYGQIEETMAPEVWDKIATWILRQ